MLPDWGLFTSCTPSLRRLGRARTCPRATWDFTGIQEQFSPYALPDWLIWITEGLEPRFESSIVSLIHGCSFVIRLITLYYFHISFLFLNFPTGKSCVRLEAGTFRILLCAKNYQYRVQVASTYRRLNRWQFFIHWLAIILWVLASEGWQEAWQPSSEVTRSL